ncbi:MAG TPA: MBG domain-containing protein, partial [Prolixibacteraceae bacterium]
MKISYAAPLTTGNRTGNPLSFEILKSHNMKAKPLPPTTSKLFSFLRFALLFLLLAGLTNVLSAQTLVIDKSDYAPGETVQITGSGWHAGEVVTLQVDHLSDPIPDHGSPNPHLPWTVNADSSGYFSSVWNVSDYEIGAELLLTAEGSVSGFNFEIFFTDTQNTVTTLTSNSNPSIFGSEVTFTAGVTRGGGGQNNTVYGSLSLLIDGIRNFGFTITQGLNTNKTFNIATLSVGDHIIKADFVGDLGAPGYNNSFATITQTVNKATAILTLSNLTRTYDGTAKSATVTTSPAGLTGVNITYNGSTTLPINAGTYAVVASLTNANYTAANVTGNLVIGPKAATVVANAKTKTYGD